MRRPGKHHVDSGRLDHRAESLIVVDAEPLGETTKNLMSLVSLYGVIGVELVLKDPFVGDDVEANRTRDKIPIIVDDQSIIFFFYSTTPGLIGEDDPDEGEHRRERRRRGGWQGKTVGR
jgi:hypothetical protein